MTTTILQPTIRDRESHPCKYCKRLAPVIVCFQTKSEIVTCCSSKCANAWLRSNMGITAPLFAQSGKLKTDPVKSKHRPTPDIVER